MSNRALIMLSDVLRQRCTQRGTRWRRLNAGEQALLVVARLRKGETYTDLAIGFGIGITTVFCDVREAIDVLTTTSPSLARAVEVARGRAFRDPDGTLLRINRVAMTPGCDRPHCSGKPKQHRVNVQVIADPASRVIWASPALPGRPTRHGSGHRTLPSIAG